MVLNTHFKSNQPKKKKKRRRRRRKKKKHKHKACKASNTFGRNEFQPKHNSKNHGFLSSVFIE